MALIPLTYKLDWYDPSQPGGIISTVNNNVNTATSFDTQFSMQDIIDTVSAGGGGASYLPLAGGTMTGGLGASVNVPDDMKWIFGTGSDLAIYHDGSNSYVQETGTGGMIVEGSVVTLRSNEAEFSFRKYFEGIDFGAATIFHSGQERLYTTGLGVELYAPAGSSSTLSWGSGNLAITGASTDQVLRFSTSGSDRLVIKDTGVRLGVGAPLGTTAPTAPLVIAGVASYADNAAAIAGGVEVGGVYRNGDVLQIVH